MAPLGQFLCQSDAFQNGQRFRLKNATTAAFRRL
jgi:hypothetical protein